ncbi:MAG TPA: hypothetical protein VF898_04130 [Chloroflexota bacterium]
MDDALVRRAASLMAAGGLSYADCFAAAAADLLSCPTLTGDSEFAGLVRTPDIVNVEVPGTDWSKLTEMSVLDNSSG